MVSKVVIKSINLYVDVVVSTLGEVDESATYPPHTQNLTNIEIGKDTVDQDVVRKFVQTGLVGSRRASEEMGDWRTKKLHHGCK